MPMMAKFLCTKFKIVSNHQGIAGYHCTKAKMLFAEMLCLVYFKARFLYSVRINEPRSVFSHGDLDRNESRSTYGEGM
jgi:hypothetical protein